MHAYMNNNYNKYNFVITLLTTHIRYRLNRENYNQIINNLIEFKRNVK